MLNILTIDLEDWYCSRALEGVIPRQEWAGCESRIHVGTTLLLQLFARHNVKATFFVLGYVAEREPDLIRRIVDEGHEIASHGYFHRHLAEQTPSEFREDLDRSLNVTTPLCGQAICGYRAPIFSFVESTIGWASQILVEHGIRYSSSIFPMKGHREYGYANAPLDPFYHPNGLWEIPMSCVEIAGLRLPATGGGYLRQFPWWLTRTLMRQCNRGGRAVNFYLHPWEVDPWQPKIGLPFFRRLRHYRGINGTLRKVEMLLEEFRFTSIGSMWTGKEVSNATA